MQIPKTLRPRLAGIDAPIKAAMLRSSRQLAAPDVTSPPATPRTLRKTRSSEGLDSPRNIPLPRDSPHGTPTRKRVMSRPTPPSPSYIPSSHTHVRGVSLDFPKLEKVQTIPLSQAEAQVAKAPATTFSKAKSMRDWTPEAFCSLLNHTSIFQLEVEAVKKLRLLLRNESAGYVHRVYCLYGVFDILLAGPRNSSRRAATQPFSRD